MRRAGTVVAIAVGLPGPVWAQPILHGAVRDSTSTQPVAGVEITVDGRPAGITDSTGEYRIDLGGPGKYQVQFSRPRYRAVLKSKNYEIEVDANPTPALLDLTWPDLASLIAAQCRALDRAGLVAVLGSVSHPTTPIPPGTVATIGWSGQDGPAVGGMAIAVSDDGSFLACGVAGGQAVEVSAQVGRIAGPVRTIRTPLAGFVELEVALPDR